MQKTIITIPSKKLVCLTIRTNKQDEFNPAKAKIGAMIEEYWRNSIPDKIDNRINPGTTICAYMDYISDHNGEYTYFIGEEVSDFSDLSDNLVEVIIPEQRYCKFTTENGVIPKVVIDAWLNIWQMTESDFNGKRAYIADFEVYDYRATNINNTILDIYIGIV
jgi:predicted transcriptional regulator YdeE